MLREARYYGSNSSAAPGAALQTTGVLLHDGFHCPLMPHWNTTGVKWLWWTMRDYGNNTLVKSSWNHFTHVDSNVNIPRCVGCKMDVCVCVSIEETIQSNVCIARTWRGQSVLAVCMNWVTWLHEGMRSISGRMYVCSLGCLMDRCLFPPSQLLFPPLSIMACCQMKLSIGLMTF